LNVRVTFIDSRGVARTIEAAPGVSVMEAALAHHVPEVASDCGGSCTCAMCHVVVDEAWLGRFAAASKNESSLLSLLEVLKPNSRLSCQLRLTAEMDGLVIHTLDPNEGA
jgi:2Fe-2S ferredoxin